MKKLERLNSNLFQNLEQDKFSTIGNINGGAEEGAGTGKDTDTKCSDYCDTWGEKGDKNCQWDNSTQADRIKTDCSNDTPYLRNPEDFGNAINTANVDYAGIN